MTKTTGTKRREGRHGYGGVYIECPLEYHTENILMDHVYLDEDARADELPGSVQTDGARPVLGGVADMGHENAYGVSWMIDSNRYPNSVLLHIPVRMTKEREYLGLKTLMLHFGARVVGPCLFPHQEQLFACVVLTEDGNLHLTTISYDRLVDNGERDMHGMDGVSKEIIHMGEGFQGSGKSTPMVCLRSNTVCIGTDSGMIMCVSIERGLRFGNAFELSPGGGLLGYLGGLFGSKQQQSGVLHLVEAQSQGQTGHIRTALCAIHDDCTLRVWDVSSRSMVHSTLLVPQQDGGVRKPSLAYCSADFLNDGNSFLVIPFEADSADGSGRVRTNLHLFEMTLEDRDGVFHFHLEMGPMFPDIPGKVVSTALEYCDARYKLWFINTFDGERSEIRCESLQGDLQGTHHTSTPWYVETLDDRLDELVPADFAEDALICSYAIAFQSILRQKNDEHSVIDCFMEEIFAPGNYSARAMLQSMHAIGVPCDNIGEFSSRKVVKDALMRFLHGVHDELDDIASSVRLAQDFIHEYVSHLRSSASPVSIHIQQRSTSSEDTARIFMIRSNCQVSYLRRAHHGEMIKYSSVGEEETSNSAYRFNKATNLIACPSLCSMIRYLVLRGCDLTMEVLPSALCTLRSTCGIEFGLYGIPDKDIQTARKSLRELALDVQNFANNLDIEAISSLVCGNPIEPPDDLGPMCCSKVDVSCAAASIFGHGLQSSAYVASSSRVEIMIRLIMLLGYRDSDGSDELIQQSVKHQLLAALLIFWSVSPNAIYLGTSGRHMEIEPLEIGELRTEESAAKRAKINGDDVFVAPINLMVMSEFTRSTKDCDPCTNPLDAWARADNFVRDLLACTSEKYVQMQLEHLCQSVLMWQPHHGKISRRSRQIGIYSNNYELLKDIVGVPQSVGAIQCLSLKYIRGLVSAIVALTEGEENDPVLFASIGTLFAVASSLDGPSEAVRGTKETISCICAAFRIKANAEKITELEYYESMSEIFERLGSPKAASRFTMAATYLLQSISGTSEEMCTRVSKAWARLYFLYMSCNELESAYCAILSISDTAIQNDSIHNFVDYLCATKQTMFLMNLPFAATDHEPTQSILHRVCHALWEKSFREPNLEHSTYLVLFDLYTARGNYQSAAAASLALSRKIMKYSCSTLLEQSLMLQKALSLSLGSLRLVAPEDAWLEDTYSKFEVRKKEFLDSQGSVCEINYTLPRIVDMAELEKEYATARAWTRVLLEIPDYTLSGRTMDEIFTQLIILGDFLAAWNFSAVVFTGAELQGCRENLVKYMAQKALRISNEDADMDIEGCDAKKSSWSIMKALIVEAEAESKANGNRLRLCALDSLLSNSTVDPPTWILQSYVMKSTEISANGSVMKQEDMDDAAGVLTILLRHGRVDSAADFALAFLSSLLGQTPSISFPNPGSVWVAHELINQTCDALGRISSERARVQEEHLKDLYKLLEEHSTTQSKALERIYAS